MCEIISWQNEKIQIIILHKFPKCNNRIRKQDYQLAGTISNSRRINTRQEES